MTKISAISGCAKRCAEARPMLRIDAICRRDSDSATGLQVSEHANPRSIGIAQWRHTPLPHDLQMPTAASFACAKHCTVQPDRRSDGSVAHLLLAVLPAFLRVQAQRRDRTRFEALDADFLVGFLAEAVTAFLDALERLVDLADQLAVAVA